MGNHYHPESSMTDPDFNTHPVKLFLEECGVNVSNFPKVKMVVEVKDAKVRAGQIYLPLRIPRSHGLTYESYCRASRVLEIPSVDRPLTHRHFLEMEWTISEHPITDSDEHSAFSFLAREMDCPSCRQIFIPEVEIVDQSAVRFVCPQCLHHWVVRVESIEKGKPVVHSLLELYRKQPAELRKKMAEWNDADTHVPEASTYFPFKFNAWDNETALEYLFGDIQGWTATPQAGKFEFEVLAKSFLNLLAFHYFRQSDESSDARLLENTDIQRLSSIERRDLHTKKAVEEIFPTEMPTTGVRWNPTLSRTTIEKMRNSPLHLPTPPASGFLKKFTITALSTAAALGLIIGFGFFVLKQRARFANAADRRMEMVAAEPAAPAKVEAPSAEEMKQQQQQQEKVLESEAKKAVEKAQATATANPSVNVPEAQAPVKAPEAEKLENQKIEKKAAAPSHEQPEHIQKDSHVVEKAKAEKIDSSFRQGMLHLKLQQSKEAIDAFKRVLMLDPHNAVSYRWLGLAYVYDHQYEQAQKAFETYLKSTGEPMDRDNVEQMLKYLKERSKNPVAQK